jgi:hypothetical protein
LREYEEQFRSKGAKLVAIGLGGTDYALHFRKQTGIDFPLLIDENRQTHKALQLKKANLFHLFRGDNMRARKRAKAVGVRQHRLGKDPFQLGGSFVFAPGNKDLFAHVSETFGDNAQPKDLLAALP